MDRVLWGHWSVCGGAIGALMKGRGGEEEE